MEPKKNEGWIEEFNEFFKGNIAKDSTLRCNTKYVKDFIRTLLSEKDLEKEEAVAEERERIIKKIAPFISNRPLDDNDLQKLYPDQIRKFLTPPTN